MAGMAAFAPMFASGQSTSPDSHQKSRWEISSITLMIAGTESIARSSDSAATAILR